MTLSYFLDPLDDRVINLLSALLGGGLFALLNGIFGLWANRKKTGSEANKIDAEADKLQAEMMASYQNQIVVLLGQSLANYQTLEKERKEKKESDDLLWAKIRERDIKIEKLEKSTAALMEQSGKDALEMKRLQGMIEEQGSALIEMNKHIGEIKKDTGKLVLKE
jgi:hypothetical protein